MKKKIILVSMIGLLSFNCASSNIGHKKEQPIETVDKFNEGRSKGLMELLMSGLVIYIMHSMIK
jgi:hypothetical protein